MKLYVVHVGYYDSEIAAGVYEAHTNFFVVAESPNAAREQVFQKPVFKAKKMHVDGIQEISAIDGYTLSFTQDADGTQITNYGYSDVKKMGLVAHK